MRSDTNELAEAAEKHARPAGDEDTDQELARSLDSLTSKRGRPALPDMWTRVVSLQHFDAEQVKLFQINADLLLENALPTGPPTKRRDLPWKHLFQPSKWKEENPDASLTACSIKKQRLKSLCKQVIEARRHLRQRAQELDQAQLL